jgi:hypothetical protein
LVYLPNGARRVEKFKASQAALEIKNEDHAGHGNVEIIGRAFLQLAERTVVTSFGCDQGTLTKGKNQVRLTSSVWKAAGVN